MGKIYYCDYCDKRFKDVANARQKHLDSLQHQRARNEHYQHFKSAKEILAQEDQKKRPCGNFPNGSCTFGALCRFSHYTPAQLAKLREQAHLDEQRETERQQPKTYSKKMIQEFVRKRKLEKEQNELQYLKDSFNYPSQWLGIQHELPPSLRLIDPKIIKQEWKPNFFGQN